MVKYACVDLQLPKICKMNNEKCTNLIWNNNISMSNVKAINVYNTLSYDESIIMYAKTLWYVDFSIKQWQKIFTRL